MAHSMKDIPASILVTEGTNVKTGVLSILEKKGVKILKSTDYQLNPLYWRLVSYAGQTYLLGYTRQLAGAKATKKLLVKGCSIDMNLPEKVVVSPHSNESFLCIQCGTKIIFLKAENKRQRNKWVDAIQSAIKEPIYYPSTVSTNSTDSSDSFDVLRDCDQRLPRSVHNTADTAPHPGADWRRVNTSPAGQFQTTNRASLLSIPSSAHALAQQRRRSEEIASSMALQSQQSAIHSLNSADRMRSLSLRELNKPAIYDDDAKYTGCEVTWESGYEEIDNDEEEDPIIPPPSSPDMPDDHFYMPLLDNDDQSSMSRVNNLGLESGGNANVHHYEDTIAPELPKRDYRSPTSVVQEGLVKKTSSKKTSSKKTRAPQPPETPIDQMDSIQREKTVCLETQFQMDNQPIGRYKSNDNKKEMPGKMNSKAQNGECLLANIQRFRSEQFQEDGFIVVVDKIDLSPESMKLVCVHDCICIAALPNAKLHSLLHVDDVIVKVNRQTLPSIDFCYTLFRTTDENKVLLHVKRVIHGVLCHVILSANGDVDSLGLQFGNQSQGNEVTAMYSEGLVAKNGSPSRSQVHGVVHGGILVNWGLVEINQSPVSFNSSPADVRNQIQRAGCELALVFIPMDLIDIFKERPCGESTEQTFKGEGTCKATFTTIFNP